MARIFSSTTDEKPRIDREAIASFFEARASKASTLGATRAVIYQDKNADLAERRDVAEKALLSPLMQLQKNDHVLDAGCGTGRWAELIIPHCASYHGIDSSPGLIDIAKQRFAHAQNSFFSVCSIDQLTLERIGSTHLFSKILSVGVYIYLNDDELQNALHCIANVSAAQAKVILREPIATQHRLTLKEHYSDEMDQYYSAIYRTESELHAMFEISLVASGFRLLNSGDVYADASLNNRAETKQKFFLFER